VSEDDKFNLADFIVTEESEKKRRQIIEHQRVESITKAFEELVAGMTRPYQRELMRMCYSDFLQTHYWEVLRRYVLLLHRDRCDQCGLTINLQVHHRSYDFIHDEYQHLDDLAVLCDRCHREQHGL